MKTKEETYARIAAWAKANRDRRNANQREWYYRDVERGREVARKWYHKNKEQANEGRKAWRKANPGKLSLQAHRRRERKLATEQCDTLSSIMLAQLIDSSLRMKCAICGKNMPKSDRTIDHIIPLSKGGSGHIGNLQIVHLSCNCRKRAQLPHEFNGQAELNFAGNGAYPNTPRKRGRRRASNFDSQTPQSINNNLESRGLLT